MPKEDGLIITDFAKAIGASPHVGFGNMQNLDVFSIPGIARINNKSVKKSGSVVTGYIFWMAMNPQNASQIWALDNNQQVYESTDAGESWAVVSGNAKTSGSGQGMIVVGDYLIVARLNFLDAYKISTGVWSNNWHSMANDTLWHPMIRSKNDGIIYGGAGKNIFSIDPVDPNDLNSFVFDPIALDLFNYERIKSLTEQGEKLIIGTWQGDQINQFRVANIYPWDRSSPSFNTPLPMEENGVNAMITVNQITHILAGIDGKVYSSNGVQASELLGIPKSIADVSGGIYLEFFPGAIMNYKGRVFFGIGCSSNVSGMGVYSLIPSRNGNLLNFEHVISTGEDGTSFGTAVTSLLPLGRDTFLMAWASAGSFGIDKINSAERYTSYTAFFESPFYRVGSNLNSATYTQGEFQLTKALNPGEGIRLKYRTDLSSSFTTIGTYDFTTLQDVSSHVFTPNIPSCEFVQIRAELTTGANSNTTPELKLVKFT